MLHDVCTVYKLKLHTQVADIPVIHLTEVEESDVVSRAGSRRHFPDFCSRSRLPDVRSSYDANDHFFHFLCNV